MKRFSKGVMIVVLMTFWFLGGCATVHPGSAELHQKALTFTPPPDMASVYVYRPYRYGGSMVHFGISLDYREFGTLGLSSYLYGYIRPGPHVLKASMNAKVTQVKFQAEAGKLYFFKVTTGWSGADIDPVDEKEGRDRVSGYTLSNDNAFEFEKVLQQ
jgi:hypothetical protein